MTIAKGVVQIPKKFFIDERKKLYQWKTDFWKELLQNSLDAGSSRLDIQVKEQDGLTLCSVEDNGCGMTAEVLNDVYFSLGETTKNTSDTIGGFGRARIMTCFGHHSYEIATRDLHVIGDGANYEIRSSDGYLHGCRVSVLMEDTSAHEMLERLNHYLSRCTLGHLNLYINGERVSSNLSRGRNVKDLSFAKVHVVATNPSLPGCVLIRVNGLLMFENHIYDGAASKKQICIEINPEVSREVLSASRRTFVADAQEEYNNFISSVTVDTRTALRNTKADHQRLVKGHGIFNMRSSNGGSSQSFAKPSVTVPVAKDASKTSSRTIAALNSISNEDASFAKQNYGQICPWLFDVMIRDETGDPAMDRVVDQYDPSNWTREVRRINGRRDEYCKGSNFLKILIAYRVAIEHSLQALVDHYDLPPMKWTVGWVFGEDIGQHFVEDEIHYFLLNPVGRGVKCQFKTASKGDMMRLIAIAKHEAVHASFSTHDENYANALTSVDAKIDQSKVLREIKEAIKKVKSLL